MRLYDEMSEEEIIKLYKDIAGSECNECRFNDECKNGKYLGCFEAVMDYITEERKK